METHTPELKYESTEHRKNVLILSASVIIAGLIVGTSIMYAGNIFKPIGNGDGEGNTVSQGNNQPDTKEILTIRSDDYVWGDPKAPVKLYEFSDLECPFCKQFHNTLNKVMSTYGTQGKVAVIYRNFPLDSIHSKARNEAVALECAGKLGGNDAFWKYAERIFAITPSNNGLDPKELPNAASFIGLDVPVFNTCLTQNPFAQKIQKEQQEGISLGVQGTPYSVVVAPNGKTFPINGAQDETSVKSILDLALQATQ